MSLAKASAGRLKCAARPRPGRLHALAAVVLCAGVAASHAEVIRHGAAAPLPGPNVTVSGDLGNRQGANLFHSFSVFNVFAGESVTYTLPTGAGAGDIGNVISRVTGGTSDLTGGKFSFIDGPINAIAGAGFWFINPNGIIFGNGAALSGASAFHFSTADYIKLGENGLFNAVPSAGDVLTSAPPSAFGFLSANPASITVATTSFNILQPPPGATLSLVAGTINVGAPDGTPGFDPGSNPPGFILADGGRLNLASVASPGEAVFDGRGFSLDAFDRGGDVNITRGSVVDAREVFIRGGRLTIDNAAVIPGFFSTFDIGAPPDGGEVNVKVSGQVSVSGSELVQDFPAGIYTFAGSVTMIAPPSDVPDITIDAGSLLLSGLANIRSERFGPGNAADVTISTRGSLEVRNGAFISVNNFFAGPGGTLTINAERVVLSGDGHAGFTGISGQSNFNDGFNGELHPDPFNPDLTYADGATVTLNLTGPGTLVVEKGAEITTDSFAFGRAGDLNVNAVNMFLSRDGATTGSIASQSVIAGRSGNLKIRAEGQIVMSGGFQISATTGGTGDGGVVDVSAGQSISMSGQNTGIFSTTVRPPQEELDRFASWFGVDYAFLLDLTRTDTLPNPDLPDVLAVLNSFGLTSVADLTIGDAGKLGVGTPLLGMKAGSRIDNSTAWDGNAGEIATNVGSLDLDTGSQIRSQSGLVRLSTGLLEFGTGNAGKITINADGANTIAISGSSSAISTTTFGPGAGGAIQLTSAGQILISNGGSVTADSFGTGFTGDINITAGTSILMDNGTISTRAVTSDGGNIKLTAPSIVRLDGSTITTSVESGVGGGGNINIDPQFVLVNNSSIIANAFGGPGGNITIIANNFLASATSIIEASSALSTPGVIEIRSPENNVENNIAQLPAAFIDASALLRGLCTARRTGAPSSFVVAGRGGVPVDADGYLPAFSTDMAVATAGRTGEPPLAFALLANTLDCAR